MNKWLFGLIGLLFLGIIGVGAASVINSQQVPATSVTPSATVPRIVVGSVPSAPTATPTPVPPTQSPTPKPIPPPISKPAPKPTPMPPAQAPGTFTLVQIASHNSGVSCYSAINGGVYDLTSWINQHPGGQQAILSLCGRDGSSMFNSVHGGQRRPEQELASFKIGTLVP